MGNPVHSEWRWKQVKEAGLDLKTYMFFVIGIFNTIPAGSLSNVCQLVRLKLNILR